MPGERLVRAHRADPTLAHTMAPRTDESQKHVAMSPPCCTKTNFLHPTLKFYPRRISSPCPNRLFTNNLKDLCTQRNYWDAESELSPLLQEQ